MKLRMVGLLFETYVSASNMKLAVTYDHAVTHTGAGPFACA